jgi:NADP-dependent 3-hydroxy acid dehydrogenase YdfG
MPVSLRTQTVLIVGASSGIGRSIAVHFAREGAAVMASARRLDRLQDLQNELAEENIDIGIAAADATNAIAIEELVARTVEQFEKIDILVYASGTNTTDRAMKHLTTESWDEVICVNLNGAYYATRAVLPAMRERKNGHLIYIASISAIVPDLSGAAYQASKRGMLGMAHAIRVEEKENNIRTCVICPGLVDTDILNKRPIKPTPELLANAMQADDVAEAVLFAAKLPARAVVTELELMPTVI